MKKEIIECMTKRPQTIYEAVRRHVDEGTSFFISMREFYDSFYRAPFEMRGDMITDEPPLTDNPRYDAYAGAVAEHFARRYRLEIPAWTLDRDKRFLKIPWFPCGIEKMKAFLFDRSPISFRRRFIFVDDDPCFRPSRNILEPECNPMLRGRE